jgi:hypothetical protein
LKNYGKRSNQIFSVSSSESVPGNTDNFHPSTDAVVHPVPIRLTDLDTRDPKVSSFTAPVSDVVAASETSVKVLFSVSPSTTVSVKSRKSRLTRVSLKTVLVASAQISVFSTLTGLVRMPPSNSTKSFSLTPTTRPSDVTQELTGSAQANTDTEK